MKKIVLLGGGGHCKSCIDVIESTGTYEIVSILDREETIGEKILTYTITGIDKDLETSIDLDYECLVTVGQISTSKLKHALFDLIQKTGHRAATVISPFAVVSKHATIQEGTIIHHGAIVNSAALVGCNCIINTGALVEHDCIIGNHTHISTGVKLNGGVTVGNNCFIGSGSTVRNGISITDDVVIGLGSVVTKSITEPGVYYGIPAKKQST